MMANGVFTFDGWTIQVLSQLPDSARSIGGRMLEAASNQYSRAMALAVSDPKKSEELRAQATRTVRVVGLPQELARLRRLRNQSAEVINCLHMADACFREKQIDEAIIWLDRARERVVWPPSR